MGRQWLVKTGDSADRIRNSHSLPKLNTAMKTAIPIAICALITLISGRTASADRQFDNWDRDGDKQLTRDELPPVARRNFDKADAPILILHGTMDMVLPFDQSVIFHQALEDANVDVTFVRVRAAGHGFRGPEIDRRVDDFLAKHLLGEDRAVSSEPVKP